MKRFKLVVPSFLALIFCMLLIAGSTFALFTSTANASIEVTSGRVEVKASVIDLDVYSAKAVDSFGSEDQQAGEITTGNFAGKYIFEKQTRNYVFDETHTYKLFANNADNTKTGALLVGNDLSLINMTAGDKVNLTLKLENKSNVNIKYRVRVNLESGLALFNELKIILNGVLLQGVSKVGTWTPLAAGVDIDDIDVEVLLPLLNENMNGDNSCKLNFVVEAVQGNAKTTNETLNTNINVTQEAQRNNNVLTDQVVSDTEELVTVTVPAAVIQAQEVAATQNEPATTVQSVAVKVEPQDTTAEANLVISSQQTAQSYDLEVLIKTQTGNETAVEKKYNEEQKAEAAPLKVQMFVGEGLKGVKLYHTFVDPNTGDTTIEEFEPKSSEDLVLVNKDFYYNEETGYITLMTNRFSEYTVAYNKPLVVETFDEEGNSTGIDTYNPTETEGVYENKDGSLFNEVEVEEGKDTVLTSGYITVTVPAAALKTSNSLQLVVKEYSQAEAEESEKFTTSSPFGNDLRKYYDVQVLGLSEQNETRLQIKFVLPDISSGIIYDQNTNVYQGTSRLYLFGNQNQPSYMTRSNNGKEITVHSTILGAYTINYAMQTDYNPNVSLTTKLGTKDVMAEVGSGSYVLADLPGLYLQFNNYTPTDDEKEKLYDSLLQSYGLYSGEVLFKAYQYSFGNFYNFGNPTYLTFPNELIEGYSSIYMIGAENFTNVDEGFKVNVQHSGTSGIIYIIGKYQSSATKALQEQIAANPDATTIIINSPYEDALVDLADVAELLSKNGITITGSLPELASVVKSTNAQINGNNINFENIAVKSGGLIINGDSLVVNNVKVDQTMGQGSTFSLTGSKGNYTVSNSTFTHLNSASAGRYGALYFEGATTTDQTEAQNTITTVDHIKITTSWDYESFKKQYVASGYYTSEELDEMFGDVNDAHKAFSSTAGWGILKNQFRNSGGLVYRNFGGTLIVKDSEIDVPYSALKIGIDAEPRYGYVNVKDSTINTTSLGTERVDYTTFDNVTFKNDWSEEAIEISSGSSYQGDLNYSFKNCTFEAAIKFKISSTGAANVHNPKITFENCTWNGVQLSLENINEFLTMANAGSSISYNSTAENGKITITIS